MTPLTLKNVDLTIAGTDYGAELSAVTLQPTASTSTWKGLKPTAVYTSVGAAAWVVVLTFAQDWSDPLSLGRYLFENEGDIATLVFKPKSGAEGFSIEAVLTPGNIGGQIDQTVESTVTLPAQGRPTFIPAV